MRGGPILLLPLGSALVSTAAGVRTPKEERGAWPGVKGVFKGPKPGRVTGFARRETGGDADVQPEAEERDVTGRERPVPPTNERWGCRIRSRSRGGRKSRGRALGNTHHNVVCRGVNTLALIVEA
ncbi:hypothetical protein Z043_101449 [Scleropages formosus]|uniref:Secreted protein n=1 Tax=Scleropages formosus TaxID=113540 RepID=A0A0P7VRJ0_SCLFO|nr:hypothetical protein Z043_101449 [Scleropages formosus]